MTSWKILIIATSYMIHDVLSANILVFTPLPWRSHQFVFKELVKALAENGHMVDFYSPIPFLNPPPGLSQIIVKDRLKEMTDDVDDESLMYATSYNTMKIIYDLQSRVLEKMFTEERAYKDLIKSKKKYDVVISEFPIAMESTAYLAHKFNAPFVAVVSLLDYPWANEIAGLPDNPSYMVNYQSRMSDRMNYFERLENFFTTAIIVSLCYWETVTRQQSIADKYLRYNGWEERPPLVEMVSNADLILMNSHVSMGYPYPKAPHVKEIGGIHIAPTNPLPKDLKEFMDNSPHGVIYFSLGSVVDAKMLVSTGRFNILVNVFKGLRQNVLWKVVPGLPEVSEPNIKTQNWFPQQDVLAHNNTVLYITHGGLQGMVEAINNGIPTIGVPIFFDQFKNVHVMVSTGMGLLLKFENISESSLKWSISEAIENPTYREHAVKRQEIFLDRPLGPKAEAVYWIEYVIKHGKVLQPASAQMPFFKVYLLDILGTIAVVLAVFAYLIEKLFDTIIQFTVPRASLITSKRKMN